MDMNGALTDGAPCIYTRVANIHLRKLVFEWYIKLEELLLTLGETLTVGCCVINLLNYGLIQACDVIIIIPEHGILLFSKFLKAQ